MEKTSASLSIIDFLHEWKAIRHVPKDCNGKWRSRSKWILLIPERSSARAGNLWSRLGANTRGKEEWGRRALDKFRNP
jgi:hypothetical protein